jgi:hypothetical protein
MSHMTRLGAKYSAPAPRPLVRNPPSGVRGSVRGDWERLLGNGVRELMTVAAAQPRRCSCGGACDSCSKQQDRSQPLARLPGPLRKSLESETDDEAEIFGAPSRLDVGCALRERLQHDERPHQGAATIVCNGAGDYRVALNSWAGAPCGVEACVRLHEESHAADWRKRWPDGCKNADGTPKPDGADIPLGGPGYDEFLRKSECDAHTVEIPCEQAALDGASKDCKPYVQDVLNDTVDQRNKYCGGGC